MNLFLRLLDLLYPAAPGHPVPHNAKFTLLATALELLLLCYLVKNL